MLNAKDLAMLMRKSNKLVIEKLDNTEYMITDTYIMVRLSQLEFSEFFSKWNSYKTTATIPFDFEATISSIEGADFVEDDLDMSMVTRQVKNSKYQVEISDFTKYLDEKEARIYKAGSELCLFDVKYNFLLDKGDDYRSAGKLDPLYVLKDDVVQAVIMPIRGKEKGMTLKEELEALIERWTRSTKTA